MYTISLNAFIHSYIYIYDRGLGSFAVTKRLGQAGFLQTGGADLQNVRPVRTSKWDTTSKIFWKI